MSSPTFRPAGTGSHTALLALLGCAILVIGVAEWAEGMHQTAEISTIEAALPPLVAGVYAATGIVAIRRRPTNWMGIILLLGSVSLLAGGLTLMASPALWGIGIIFSTTILAAMVHALHAFPTGRLRGRWSVTTVVAAWTISLVLQLPIYLFGQFSPLQSGPDRQLYELFTWVQQGAGFAVMASTAALLTRRVLDADRRQRTVLAPLYLYGIAAVLLVELAARIFENADPLLRLTVQYSVIAGVPVAFLLAMLRGGFTPTGRLDDLNARLANATPTQRELTQSLSHTIGDSSSEIFYWSTAIEKYVGDDGSAVAVPPERGVVEVRIDDRLVGAISYDEVLVGERSLVEAAARVLALAIDRERLAADLRASHEQLRASRERLVTAADEERRRIARDLHDGLQTRLVLIALTAGEAQRSADARTLNQLKTGVDLAIDELRSFVHGVMPAVLTERGLASAIREIAAELRMPVTLKLSVGEERLVPAIETAAFMLVAESVTNTLKHAAASAVRIVAAREGEVLHVAVTDDGVGGAIVTTRSGLGGLRDRIEAVGGTMEIADAPTGGTVVEAVFPLDRPRIRARS